MTDNVTVSNTPTSTNPDIPVRTLDKSGKQVQVMAVDYGGAGAEDLTVPDFATETTLQNISNAVVGGLYFNITANSDILGVGVTGRRNNGGRQREYVPLDLLSLTRLPRQLLPRGSPLLCQSHTDHS